MAALTRYQQGWPVMEEMQRIVDNAFQNGPGQGQLPAFVQGPCTERNDSSTRKSYAGPHSNDMASPPCLRTGQTAGAGPAPMSFRASGRQRDGSRSRRAGLPARKGEETMGQPVVHFEVVGKDGAALQSFYSDLFGWKIDSNNPMQYGVISQESNGGIGIGGGIGQGPDGYAGHVTFYVGVPDVEAALAEAERLGGTRTMGPEQVMEDIEIGLFTDPEGHTIGVIKIPAES
jgi:predicted enzyme related to lactoylglutathione lyase